MMEESDMEDMGTENETSNKYACYLCKMTFFENQDLISHFQVKHPTNMYKCDACDEVICDTGNTVLQHVRMHIEGVQINVVDQDTINSFTPEWTVEPLGEFDPYIRQTNKLSQRSLLLKTALRSKSLKPDMKLHVTNSLEKFLRKYKFSKRYLPSTIIKCDDCGTVFPKKSFNNHFQRMHAPQKLFSCCHCDYECGEKRQFLMHIESSHFGGETLICEFCDKEYQRTKAEQPHMMTESCQKYKCSQDGCKRGFKTELRLTRHLTLEHTIHDEKPILCELCGKKLKNRSSLSAHKKTMHNPDFKAGSFACEICDKKFFKPWIVEQHKRKVHNPVLQPCPVCNKVIKKTSLKIHMEVHYGPQYPCKYCGKLLSKKKLQQLHEMRHEGKTDLKCPTCRRLFTTSEGLEKHKLIHTDGSVLAPYMQPASCDICLKTFKNKYTLQKHMPTHNSVKKESKQECVYYCAPCKKLFLQPETYHTHLSTAHPDGIDIEAMSQPVEHKATKVFFPCDLCPKTFAAKQMLMDHRSAKHEGIKRHICHVCNKAFNYLPGKHKHLRKIHGIVVPRTQSKHSTLEGNVASQVST